MQSVGAEHARGGSIDTLSAIAKIFSSESAFTICDRALQLHGALGFLETTGVARMLRDCRITRIFEGANDVLLVRVGAARLAAVLDRVAAATPDPTWTWTAIARQGAVAARAGDLASARKACAQCHEPYKAPWRASHRTKQVP